MSSGMILVAVRKRGGRKNNEDEEIRAPSRPDTELSVVPQGTVLEL